jgi:hypothetical protein
VYSVFIIHDSFKLQASLDATSPEFDIRYFKDILKIKQKSPLAEIPMEQGKEYINVYAPPYRYVIENNENPLMAENYEVKTANALAALALIHDRFEVLDMLINRYEDIDLNHLFLLSCLYAKTDLFPRLEKGAYGFDVNQLLVQDGTTLINYAAASGNVPFFESIYAKYYQEIINGLSNNTQKSFKELIWRWARTTGNGKMLNISIDIEEGKYSD